MNTFKFNLSQKVTISISGENGVIRGRSDSVDCSNRYFVAYKSAQGNSTESWISEDQLEASEA